VLIVAAFLTGPSAGDCRDLLEEGGRLRAGRARRWKAFGSLRHAAPRRSERVGSRSLPAAGLAAAAPFPAPRLPLHPRLRKDEEIIDIRPPGCQCGLLLPGVPS